GHRRPGAARARAARRRPRPRRRAARLPGGAAGGGGGGDVGPADAAVLPTAAQDAGAELARALSTPPRRGGRSGAGAVEVVGMAWRAIRANVLRSVLTTLGIVIGVAAVVALTSVGAGVTAGITERLTSLGTNLLTVTGRFGGGGFGLVRGGGRPSVTLADAE